ncbi:hypothetical protein DPMN_102260 [Dreissena polymorpha]|uniref:Uncharacterized protein n=1 Tax=Dreissena polymorpha TaxID=45954 RepID=A0A9D4LIR6_DREPO|nr:hypothetical protein DPMN_102260 [Dreissena polymorpha]
MAPDILNIEHKNLNNIPTIVNPLTIPAIKNYYSTLSTKVDSVYKVREKNSDHQNFTSEIKVGFTLEFTLEITLEFRLEITLEFTLEITLDITSKKIWAPFV